MRLASLAVAATCIFALAACAGGREPNPVAVHKPGDDSLSCAQIRGELDMLNARFPDLVNRQAEVWRKNARLAAGVPSLGATALWMMEDGNAQEVELTAAQKRFYNLVDMSMDKRCRLDDATRPVMAPPNSDWAEPDTILAPAYSGYEKPHDYPHETIRIVHPRVNSVAPVETGQPIPEADHMRDRRDLDSVFRDDYADTVGAPSNQYPIWYDGHYKTRRWTTQ